MKRVTVRRMGKLHVGYGRVSTASGEQLSALEGQLRWLKEQGCDPILHDVESGLVVDRPDYGQLLELITSGRAAVVRATRADRLGRDAPELVRLVQHCDRAGVVVLTRVDGRLSARTAEELLLLYVRAALAQGESMKIAQRVNAALREGRSIGKPMRRPCWGYRLRADRLALERPVHAGTGATNCWQPEIAPMLVRPTRAQGQPEDPTNGAPSHRPAHAGTGATGIAASGS